MKKDIVIKKLYLFSKIFKINPLFFFYLKKIYNRPSTLMVHPNYECNFDCSYCYLKVKQGYCLSFTELKNLIIQAKGLGVYSVDILGGEPLMYKHLQDLINFIIKNKMLVSIYTNGALIDTKILNKLKECNLKIIFVVKLDSRNGYRDHNNPGILYNKILAKIKLTKKFGFKVMTFTVVTRKNYAYIDEIISFCNKEDIVPIFERFAPVKDEKLNKELMINSKMWKFVLEKVNSFWRTKGVDDFIDFYARLNGGICSCLSNNIAVMQNGIVKPCPEAHDGLIYGDVKKESLKKIWRNSLKLRNEFMEIPESCKNCYNSKSCRGGCKVYTYQIKRNLQEKDPLCCGKIITTFPHCGFSLLRANILFERKIFKETKNTEIN